jgi:hypothetical protein
MRAQVRSVTASPFEVQRCSPAGDELVERVAMPPLLVTRVQGFIADHSPTEPCAKFSRLRRDVVDDIGFGLEALKSFGGEFSTSK